MTSEVDHNDWLIVDMDHNDYNSKSIRLSFTFDNQSRL